MDARAAHAQITEELLKRLEESKYQDVPALNRIEERIRSRKELERYIQVLMTKLEGTNFRSATVFERFDRAVDRLDRLDRHTAA